MKDIPLWSAAGVVFAASAAAQEAPAPGEAYYYFCLGRMAEMQMQAETAVSNYQEVIRLDPTAAYPHVALAELYQRMRQVDKALESAKRAVELGPDVAAAHRTLGEVYFTLLRSGGAPISLPSRSRPTVKQSGSIPETSRPEALSGGSFSRTGSRRRRRSSSRKW
jgi:tetratricopeptide (TPR) repeat protein